MSRAGIFTVHSLFVPRPSSFENTLHRGPVAAVTSCILPVVAGRVRGASLWRSRPSCTHTSLRLTKRACKFNILRTSLADTGASCQEIKQICLATWHSLLLLYFLILFHWQNQDIFLSLDETVLTVANPSLKLYFITRNTYECYCNVANYQTLVLLHLNYIFPLIPIQQ